MKDKIKKQLFELADEKYKEFHGGLCPGTDNIIGVRVFWGIMQKSYLRNMILQNY